jgi:hypothetical protein
MNKENAKEFLPYVQALADGKQIQYQQWCRDTQYWVDFENDEEIGFCDDPEDYRIKPEPRTFVIYINKHTHQICHQNRSDSNWERITVQEVLK